ncbi:MAG: cell division protein FtsW [Alphaproteobacteria bacterium TMED199]|jgi:cell division protein FtsW|nr:MAG: cell division protein FtsW [Alphaproteobacteria bacterium TMED199]
MNITRSDRSNLALWWWTIDRYLLTSFFILMMFGIFLVMASSQHLAENLNISSHHFTIRHILYGALSIPIIIFFSILNERQTKMICILGITITTLLLFVVLFDGEKIKGAQRWFFIGGLSFQPSEIGKPLYVVFNAWLLSLWVQKTQFSGWMWSIASIILISSLLLLQPDLGMTIIMLFTWGFQLFITGIPLIIIICLIMAFPIFMIFSYQHFDHVKIRIDNFLEGKTYQISKSLQSFESGGFWGKGPGEGFYKKSLPDAHSDFVFAVAAEEYGALICSVIIIIYALIIIRSFYYTMYNNNLFYVLALGGLAFQLGFQSLIHMASNTDLIPTKGMTLPFLSYGGSSLLASAITAGIILSLTKKSKPLDPLRKEIYDI